MGRAGDDDAARVLGDPALRSRSSSGFQSWQYRLIEFMLGNKNAAMLKPHAHRPDLLAQVRGGCTTRRRSTTRALRLLARRGLPVPAERARARLVRSPTSRATAVEQAWLVVYRDPEALLGPVPARRGADRPRGHVPPLALPPCDDGRARHRLQARHRRHGRRQLSAQDARRRPLPRDLEAAHGSVAALCRWIRAEVDATRWRRHPVTPARARPHECAQRLANEVEPVLAEEHRLADEEGRRTEDAARDRFLGVGDEPAP